MLLVSIGMNEVGTPIRSVSFLLSKVICNEKSTGLNWCHFKLFDHDIIVM